MASKSTGRESDQFNLRFPEGMRDRLKVAAEESGRSMNAEIVHRLETSFDESSALNIVEEARKMEAFFHQLEDAREKMQALHDRTIGVYAGLDDVQREKLVTVLTRIRLDPKIRDVLGKDLDDLDFDVLAPKKS